MAARRASGRGAGAAAARSGDRRRMRGPAAPASGAGAPRSPGTPIAAGADWTAQPRRDSTPRDLSTVLSNLCAGGPALEESRTPASGLEAVRGADADPPGRHDGLRRAVEQSGTRDF